eukprot:gene8573-6014_t
MYDAGEYYMVIAFRELEELYMIAVVRSARLSVTPIPQLKPASSPRLPFSSLLLSFFSGRCAPQTQAEEQSASTLLSCKHQRFHTSMSVVVHFVLGDAPTALAGPSVESSRHAPKLTFDWKATPPLLLLANYRGDVMRRWQLQRKAGPSPRHSAQPPADGVARAGFVLQIPGDVQGTYLALPVAPEVGDAVATPRTHLAATAAAGADDLLVKGVDFRSKMGRRFAATRVEFGTVMRTAAFNANDVMNAVEVQNKRREREETQREKLVGAIESGAGEAGTWPRSSVAGEGPPSPPRLDGKANSFE